MGDPLVRRSLLHFIAYDHLLISTYAQTELRLVSELLITTGSTTIGIYLCGGNTSERVGRTSFSELKTVPRSGFPNLPATNGTCQVLMSDEVNGNDGENVEGKGLAPRGAAGSSTCPAGTGGMIIVRLGIMVGKWK